MSAMPVQLEWIGLGVVVVVVVVVVVADVVVVVVVVVVVGAHSPLSSQMPTTFSTLEHANPWRVGVGPK